VILPSRALPVLSRGRQQAGPWIVHTRQEITSAANNSHVNDEQHSQKGLRTYPFG
jgi:hypothetical protein